MHAHHSHRQSTRLAPRYCFTAAAIVFAYSLPQPAQASPQATQCAVSTTAGLQVGTHAGIGKLSGNGQFVLFYSQVDPSGAVPVTTYPQLYLRNLATGAVSLITQPVTGGYSQYQSLPDGLSGDGRFVAFTSRADDLVPNDQNGQAADAFVRDMTTGVTEIASVSSSGNAGNDESGLCAISADGRYVAFKSFASNLVAGDFNQLPDIFVRDRTLQLTTRVSVSSLGAEAICPPNGCSGFPTCVVDSAAISGDGRFVAFTSAATNLVPNDTNQALDVFVHDTWTGTTELVTQTPGGAPSIFGGIEPSVSFDGRYVAFIGGSNDLVAGLAPIPPGSVFVRDRVTGTNQFISLGTAGQLANSYCDAPIISGNGAFVVFNTDADNLVTPDTNATFDAFLRDISAGTTVRLSNSVTGGVANGYTEAAGISNDGALALLNSATTNMVAGDIGLGAGPALVDRTITAPPIVTYCTGKTNSSNCTPAIAPTGLPSISGRYVFFVTATKVLNQRFGSLVWGTAAAQTPFMGGTLCVQAPTKITAPQDSHGDPAPSTNCSGWHSFQMTPQWMQARGWLAGTTICCQYFCRDPALAAPNQMSLSDGLRFTVVP